MAGAESIVTSPRNAKSLDYHLQQGILHQDGDNLRTVDLFHVDCNFAFKHVGRQMMFITAENKSLAPLQYGSTKRQRATDLARNKAI